MCIWFGNPYLEIDDVLRANYPMVYVGEMIT